MIEVVCDFHCHYTMYTYVNMKKNVIPNYLVGQITGNILYLLESRFPADIQRKQTGA